MCLITRIEGSKPTSKPPKKLTHMNSIENTNSTESRNIAYIFEDVGRYFVVANGSDLHANGNPMSSKAAAMRHAKELGYTHATGSGTYAKNRISKL